jgi:hypothetical protein
MDSPSLFGLLALAAILVFYALECRTSRVMMAVVGACAAASAYSFFRGGWPFGLIEAAWAITVARRWWSLHKA